MLEAQAGILLNQLCETDLKGGENVMLDPFPWQIGIRSQLFGVQYCCSYNNNAVTHFLSGILLSLSLLTSCLIIGP